MADGLTFSRVISSGSNGLVVQGSDGHTYTVTGTRNNRNNNPGNIAAGAWANAHGAIGSDGIGSTPLAVFPDVSTGRDAQETLQFSPSSRYYNMTIGQAMQTYAPTADHNDPVAYANSLASALGVSPDTRLSELTPAQRSTYLAAQQRIEGSVPQTIVDGQGNVVQTPPAEIPFTGLAVGAPPARPVSIADLYGQHSPQATGTITPLTRLFNGPTSVPDPGPVVGAPPAAPASIANLYGQHYTPVPLAPTLQDAPSAPGGYGSSALTQAQRLAMLAVPSTPPMPQPDPRGDAAAAPTGPTNAKGYVIGQTYRTADGASFVANADGSFSKSANTPRPLTAIQLAFAAPTIEKNIQQAGATVKNAATNVGNAVGGGLGSFFGGLGGMFGGKTAAPSAPGNGGWDALMAPETSLMQSVASGSITGSVSTPNGPAPSAANNGGWNALMAPSASAPSAAAPSHASALVSMFANSSGSPDDRQTANDATSGAQRTTGGIAGTVQMPAGARPSSVPDMSSPTVASTPLQQLYGGPSLEDRDAAAAPAFTTRTVQQQKQVINPAYTEWVNMSGAADPYQNAAFNYAMSQQPAPPKYITVSQPVTVHVAAPAPAAPAPVPAAPPPTTIVQMYQAQGLSPSQAYSAAAAKALASQPNGNVNNMGNANGQSVASGQSMAHSMGGMPG